MGNKSMGLTVPIGTTDEQLVTILEKVLPDHLVKTMNMNPIRAKMVAKEMARNIVYEARRCNQAHLVPEVANRIDINPPSKAECDAFKTAVEETIVIRYGKVGSHEMPWVKKTSGVLWLFLRERVLGLPPEKEEFYGNAVTGPRG